MAQIGFTFREARGGFFDRDKVIRAVDAAARRVLSKFGAFVRQRARTSIRSRKGTSAPGEPPFSHVGTLRRLLFFAYDPATKSVVAGPVLLGDASEAPRLLESGGQSVRRSRRGTRRLHHRPRPFMGPALEQERQKLDPLWRDSVR